MVRFLAGLMVAFLAIQFLEPGVAAYVAVAALVIGVGPLRLLRMVYGVILIALAFA